MIFKIFLWSNRHSSLFRDETNTVVLDEMACRYRIFPIVYRYRQFGVHTTILELLKLQTQKKSILPKSFILKFIFKCQRSSSIYCALLIVFRSLVYAYVTVGVLDQILCYHTLILRPHILIFGIGVIAMELSFGVHHVEVPNNECNLSLVTSLGKGGGS